MCQATGEPKGAYGAAPSAKGTAKVCQATGEPKGADETKPKERTKPGPEKPGQIASVVIGKPVTFPCPVGWCRQLGLCQGNRQYNVFSKHWRNYHHPQVLLHWCPIPACGYMTVERAPLRRHISNSHEAQAQKALGINLWFCSLRDNIKYQAPGSATPHSDPFSGLQNCSVPTKLPDDALPPDGRQAVWDGEEVRAERKKPTCPELEAAISGSLPTTEDQRVLTKVIRDLEDKEERLKHTREQLKRRLKHLEVEELRGEIRKLEERNKKLEERNKELMDSNKRAKFDTVADLRRVSISRGYVLYPHLDRTQVFALTTPDVRRLELSKRRPTNGAEVL